MVDRVSQLPQAAQVLVAQIEALLEQASGTLADPASPPDASYALRATRDDYLPQTIARYLAVPEPLRAAPDDGGKSADTLLLEQLSVLLRAVTVNLEILAAHHRTAQAAQGRFLAERFDDRATTVATVDAAQVAPAAAKRFISNLLGESASDPKAIVGAASQRLSELLPRFTQVERGGLFGTGAIERVHVTIASPDGNALRYSLSGRDNVIGASCTRIVKGVPIKTVTTSLDEWFESLYEEIAAYSQHHADVRKSLERFL